MRIPWLKGRPVNYGQVPGKQLYIISGSPPYAQSVIDGKLKAELRIVHEPLFSTDLYPAAGIARIDLFRTPVQGTTANGLLLDETLTNMSAAGQLGEPEVFDFSGLSVVYEQGMPGDEINALLDSGALRFQFSSSQPVFTIPLHQFPASTGTNGTGTLFEQRNIQVGAPFSSNSYDVTVNGFPRRIWSLETWTVSLIFRNVPPVLSAPRRIQVLMQGIHYIR